MSKQKKKLLFLIAIQIVITIVHNLLDTQSGFDPNWYKDAGWHYWLGMGFGIYLVFYILTRSCKKCKKPQIIVGPAISQWRWPEDSCWHCGEKIN